MKKYLIAILFPLLPLVLSACASMPAQAMPASEPAGDAAAMAIMPPPVASEVDPPSPAGATADLALALAAENDHLEAALAMTPGDATRFAFTHWGRLKRHHHMPDLTSQSDRDTRTFFMLRVLKGNQAAAAMDREFFRYQAQNWGWDSTDLVWEAEGGFEALIASVHLLRFRPDYDFAPLVALLQSRQFEASLYDGVTIYSAPLDTDAEWHFRSPLAHHNIAILDGEGLLVMSPLLESVQRALDTRRGLTPSLADRPRVQRVAFRLAGMAGVEIQLGAAACQQFSPYYQERGGATGAAQMVEWPVQPYQLLAAGHAFSNEAQTDLILFYYDDYRLAQNDFKLRRQLLTMGQSPFRKTPYSQQFILEEATLEDALLIYALTPSPTLPSRPG